MSETGTHPVRKWFRRVPFLRGSRRTGAPSRHDPLPHRSRPLRPSAFIRSAAHAPGQEPS